MFHFPQITKDEFFAEVAKEIIQYVCRDLSDEVNNTLVFLLSCFCNFVSHHI